MIVVMKRREFITLLAGSEFRARRVGLGHQHEKANHEQGNH